MNCADDDLGAKIAADRVRFKAEFNAQFYACNRCGARAGCTHSPECEEERAALIRQLKKRGRVSFRAFARFEGYDVEARLTKTHRKGRPYDLDVWIGNEGDDCDDCPAPQLGFNVALDATEAKAALAEAQGQIAVKLTTLLNVLMTAKWK